MEQYFKQNKLDDWINLIREYTPYNEQEKKDKETILQCIDRFDDVLSRENQIAHITSSAFVMNKTMDKVLMVYHNIFNWWSWIGGHADGEEDLLSLAFLLQGHEREELIIKPDENSDVQWILIDEIDSYSNEEHMKIIYDKIGLKLKGRAKG